MSCGRLRRWQLLRSLTSLTESLFVHKARILQRFLFWLLLSFLFTLDPQTFKMWFSWLIAHPPSTVTKRVRSIFHTAFITLLRFWILKPYLCVWSVVILRKARTRYYPHCLRQCQVEVCLHFPQNLAKHTSMLEWTVQITKKGYVMGSEFRS
jgi:hypothetical protein